MKRCLSSAPTYKQYIESLSDSTLNKMKKEREDKLLEPYKTRDRDMIEEELEIIIEVLEKRDD